MALHSLVSGQCTREHGSDENLFDPSNGADNVAQLMIIQRYFFFTRITHKTMLCVHIRIALMREPTLLVLIRIIDFYRTFYGDFT